MNNFWEKKTRILLLPRYLKGKMLQVTQKEVCKSKILTYATIRKIGQYLNTSMYFNKAFCSQRVFSEDLIIRLHRTEGTARHYNSSLMVDFLISNYFRSHEGCLAQFPPPSNLTRIQLIGWQEQSISKKTSVNSNMGWEKWDKSLKNRCKFPHFRFENRIFSSAQSGRLDWGELQMFRF